MFRKKVSNFKKKYYITTAIDYLNAKPHIGHAWEKIVADVLARWHRLNGEDVFFLTGTDEHGEKVARAAEQSGIEIKKFVDGLAKEFKNSWEKLNISFDRFIRTTDSDHEKLVQEFIKKIFDNGDIYKGDYEGYYCVPCEAFYTESEAPDRICPIHKKPLELLKEESYFFKLSKYQDKLLEFYKQNPEFISPVHRRDEIINRINEGLKDLSITRKAIKWGVPFSIDKNFVLYVWVDALLNYITALGWPKGKFKKYWPADLHIVGKEINWFHTVIWPAMLFSVGVERPKKVFAHGWLTLEGQKISKSLGNVIDPVYLVEKYGADAVRYYIIRQIPFGEDGDFSEKALVERINGELVADLGNLVYRVLTLAERFDGKIEGKDELSKNFDLKKIDECFEKVELHNAIGEVWNFIRATNKYINEKEPWKLKGKELGNVLYNLLEAVRIISILISPFLSESSERINKQLGVKAGALKDCKFKEWKGKVKKGKYLFQKIE